MRGLFVSILLLLSFFIKAQQSETAFVLKKKTNQKGIFSPYKRGVGNNLELKSFLLAEPVLPHFILKKQWSRDSSKYVVATQHSIVYPSILLKTISGEGTGGVLPPDTKVPFMLNTTNKVFITKVQQKDTLFSEHTTFYTLYFGFSYGLKFGNYYIPTIDYPFVFQRTNGFSNKWLFELGVNGEFPLSKRIVMLPRCGFYALPIVNEWFYSGEIRLDIGFSLTKKMLLKTGVIASLGNYPFGQMNKAIPLVDLVWSW